MCVPPLYRCCRLHPDVPALRGGAAQAGHRPGHQGGEEGGGHSGQRDEEHGGASAQSHSQPQLPEWHAVLCMFQVVHLRSSIKRGPPPGSEPRGGGGVQAAGGSGLFHHIMDHQLALAPKSERACSPAPALSLLRLGVCLSTYGCSIASAASSSLTVPPAAAAALLLLQRRRAACPRPGAPPPATSCSPSAFGEAAIAAAQRWHHCGTSFPLPPCELLLRSLFLAPSLLPPYRSAEGRRRVISDLVRTLAPSPEQAERQLAADRQLQAAAAAAGEALAAADSPYICRPGAPPAHKVSEPRLPARLLA